MNEFDNRKDDTNTYIYIIEVVHFNHLYSVLHMFFWGFWEYLELSQWTVFVSPQVIENYHEEKCGYTLKSSRNISLSADQVLHEDPAEVAELFNHHFISTELEIRNSIAFG